MMRTLLGSALVAAVAVGLGGCTKETKPGGPGAVPAQPQIERSYRTPETDDDRTFTLAVPRMDTNLDRGEQKELTVSIDRGSKFDQAVTLTFKAPTGVTVSPDKVVLNAKEEEAKVSVAASADAPIGNTQIQVTGTPQTGKAVSANLPIEVKKVD